jgi:nitrite reductase (NADH) small subunit
MTTHHWVRVTSADSIPLREGRAVTLGGLDIAIFNLGDRFIATDNSCPHQGGPLCDGIVAGDAIVCPLHAWKVHVGSGAVERPKGREDCVRTYPARVEDGIVLLGLPVDLVRHTRTTTRTRTRHDTRETAA